MCHYDSATCICGSAKRVMKARRRSEVLITTRNTRWRSTARNSAAMDWRERFQLNPLPPHVTGFSNYTETSVHFIALPVGRLVHRCRCTGARSTRPQNLRRRHREKKCNYSSTAIAKKHSTLRQHDGHKKNMGPKCARGERGE